MDRQEFESLVARAIERLPPEFQSKLDNVDIVVEEWPTGAQLRQARIRNRWQLLGLYQGVALTERDSSYAGSLPDTITIFREALLEVCSTEAEVVEEVAVTVIHEMAHHFGIDDDRLHELGWG